MKSGLEGRTAIVTGASRGIGFAIAASLLEEGVDVAMTARNAEQVEDAVRRLNAAGYPGTAAGFPSDTGVDESVEAAVSSIVDWKGGIEVLINNAGPQLSNSTIDVAGVAPFVDVFTAKAGGAVRMIQAVLPHLPTDGTGSIVNVTGVTAVAHIPGASMTAATNSGIAAITKYLAIELGPKSIRVNAVCPGVTLTEGWINRGATLAEQRGITPDEFFLDLTKRLSIVLGRCAEPSEIANIVTFLASDLASFVTGQVIVADGGQSADAI